MSDNTTATNPKSNNGIAAAAVIIIIILIVAGIALFYSGNKTTATSTTILYNSTTVGYSTTVAGAPSSSASTTVSPSGNNASNTPVAITDPPEVPAGTSALVVSYSAVDVQPSNTTVAWIRASGSGSINLLNVTNSSKIVGYANISAGQSIRATRINVSSAYMIVNGTKYNVTVPGQITANATGSAAVASNSVVLVVLSPVVVATYNDNTTAFVMAPSARAIVWANATAGLSLGLGTTLSINGNARSSITASAPNITIAYANVSASANNMTSLTVTVHDNSNSSVMVTNVEVYGPQNVSTVAGVYGAAGIGIGGITTGANVTIGVGAGLKSFQETSFVVSSSGSLQLASNSTTLGSGGAVVVNPGSSLALSYNGVMSYNNGQYRATTTRGTPYRVVVVGQGGAVASTTVTGG